MSFIDELNIYAQAGKGGDGVVRWRKEKFIPKGGPAGGDGGRGGNFYVKGVRDIHILSKYKSKKEFKANDGESGGNKSLQGKRGEDYVLDLPIGSIVTNLETEEKWQIEKEGEEILILRGGYGGYGNEHFKSSTNVSPTESNKGEDGQKANLHIELELFADIGFVGLPNAGKSSLLKTITNASPKIGSYAFTTLDPNLGDFYGYVLADIPGIIEGASLGKGLGLKFLRHIKRTKRIAHLISFENENMYKAYKEIRNELKQYDVLNKLNEDGLFSKKEIIILTKKDIIDNQELINKKLNEFKNFSENVYVLSLYDDESIKNIKEVFSNILNQI